MQNFIAFTLIMLIWTISNFVSKKTKSIISSLFVAAIIFLVGFMTGILPKTILTDSSLLGLGQTIIAFVLVHTGTMISINDLKVQWKTVIIGVSAVLGVAIVMLLVGGFFFDGIAYVIGSIGALTGATVSIIIVQEAAAQYGLASSVKTLPVLVAAFQGLVGFPLSAIILKKEAKRLQKEYRAGNLKLEDPEIEKNKKTLLPPLPEIFDSTAGALFIIGVVVIVASLIDQATGGLANKFVLALIFGITLRSLGVFKKNILNGTDALGLMLLSIMIIIFAPLASVSPQDLQQLMVPLVASFVIGVSGNMIFSFIAGKVLGYSPSMSIAVGLTSLYGFPGTMILSQEAAKNTGETEEEVKAIESQILPKMVIAGFATVTITSVILTSILVSIVSP